MNRARASMCAFPNPIDRRMLCAGLPGHDGPHHFQGIAWGDERPARGFWTQDANGNDCCVAVTYSAPDAAVVWDALKRARSIVMEREHSDDRYKGRFVRGWSEDDGYFYAESPDEDPGSAHV